jgi:hypothetical protein
MMPTPRVAAGFGRHRVVAVARHRFVSAQYRHILHTRRGQGLCRAAVPRHLHHRQVAEMSFLLRSLMCPTNPRARSVLSGESRRAARLRRRLPARETTRLKRLQQRVSPSLSPSIRRMIHASSGQLSRQPRRRSEGAKRPPGPVRSASAYSRFGLGKPAGRRSCRRCGTRPALISWLRRSSVRARASR